MDTTKSAVQPLLGKQYLGSEQVVRLLENRCIHRLDSGGIVSIEVQQNQSPCRVKRHRYLPHVNTLFMGPAPAPASRNGHVPHLNPVCLYSSTMPEDPTSHCFSLLFTPISPPADRIDSTTPKHDQRVGGEIGHHNLQAHPSVQKTQRACERKG